MAPALTTLLERVTPLADGREPRHVLAFLLHDNGMGTLLNMASAPFALEVKIARQCADQWSAEKAEKLARVYGVAL